MSLLRFVPPQEIQRLRGLPLPAAAKIPLLADACRLNTLYAIKRAGSGHIGSSFSSMDLVAWLYFEALGPDDVYFSSKGHDVPALYAVLAAKGVLEPSLLHRLRRLGGLPGHPDVGTPGIPANTGSLGMGISKGKGILHARKLQGRAGRVFVMTGDGELQEGQIWESLQQAANLGLGGLTVLADCNKIQSDLWVKKVSDLGDLQAKARAFGWDAQRVDGHDPVALEALFRSLAQPSAKPRFIVCDTVKGKGVSFMEGMGQAERLYGYHSGAPSDVDYRKGVEELLARIDQALEKAGQSPLQTESPEAPAAAAAPAGRAQNLVASYSREIVRLADEDQRVVVLDADLAKDCGLLRFEEKFPGRFFECGIAEQDMVSQAGAMARQGLVPFVHSFACFLSSRPNEQMYNNALERSKVVYVASLAGLLPAGPGTSHQAVRDIASVASLPGLDVIEPSDPKELSLALDWAVRRSPGSTYLRLVSLSCEIPWERPADEAFTPGRGTVLREGADGVLFAYGPLMLGQAWKAAELLQARGFSLRLVAHPWLNRVDAAWLKDAVGDRPWVFTLDNHYLEGGLGARLATAMAESFEGALPKVRRFGLDRTPVCGTYDEVLKAHGFDAESLAAAMAACLQEDAERDARPVLGH